MADNIHGVMVTMQGDVAVIKVHGPLKLGDPTLDELRRQCGELGSRECRRVVLDLEHVPAIDSSGIGVLLHGYTSMRNRGGECRLLKPGRVPLQVLRVVGLPHVFEVHQDLQEAIASFHRAA